MFTKEENYLGYLNRVLLNPPTTDHLPTEPPSHRPQTHRPTDPIIIFKRLEDSKTFTLQNTNTAEKM